MHYCNTSPDCTKSTTTAPFPGANSTAQRYQLSLAPRPHDSEISSNTISVSKKKVISQIRVPKQFLCVINHPAGRRSREPSLIRACVQNILKKRVRLMCTHKQTRTHRRVHAHAHTTTHLHPHLHTEWPASSGPLSFGIGMGPLVIWRAQFVK